MGTDSTKVALSTFSTMVLDQPQSVESHEREAPEPAEFIQDAVSALNHDTADIGQESLFTNEASTVSHGASKQRLTPSVRLDLPVIDRKRSPRPSTQILAEWEGYVESVGNDTFYATLYDLSAGEQSTAEAAEFPLEEVSVDDQALLEPGAIFRWIIGYEISPSGRKTRASSIVFRRLPAWNDRDRQRNALDAQHIAGSITWE